MSSPSPPPPTELAHSTYYRNDQLAADAAAAADERPHDPDAWRRIKPFPAGARKRPIRFVPAGSTPSTFPERARPQSDGASVAANYLQLVGLAPRVCEPAAGSDTCVDCGLPRGADAAVHERSTAHQASLAHSFPPHHLPRSNVGLKILQDAGWDPDARVGLGAAGQGTRYPVKAVAKKDRRGVGVRAGKHAEKLPVEKEKPLGVKAAQKKAEATRRRREGLMRELGGNIDLGALLGEGQGTGLR